MKTILSKHQSLSPKNQEESHGVSIIDRQCTQHQRCSVCDKGGPV